MKIRTKVAGSSLLMAALLFCAVAVGFSGTKTLSETLNFVLGPAWDTADGAMEGTIEVEAQMLAVEKLAAGVDAMDQLKSAREGADEAFGRMKSAGIIKQELLTELDTRMKAYREELDTYLTANTDRKATLAAFNEFEAKLNRLSEKAESIGDQGVEVLEQARDKPISWEGGLDKIWLAADGGMENRIALLDQHAALALLATGADWGKTYERLEAAIKLQEESLESMLPTGSFESPAGDDYPGQSIATAMRESFIKHKAKLEAYVSALKQSIEVRTRYVNAASQLLELVGEVEEEGDATVEGKKESIAASQSQIYTLLMVTAVIGILVALSVGILLSLSVSKRLREIQKPMQDIAEGEGDLTVRLPAHSRDELGELGHWFNTFLERLSAMFVEVKSSASVFESDAHEISQNSHSLSRVASDEAASIQEISASIREVSGLAESTAETAKEAAELSRVARSAASAGSGKMTEMRTAMSAVEESSGDIAKVIKVIDEIAFQTNLLALNAAVEAARAGEAGKGFAVVAEEVRNLAQRSAEAARSTVEMVEQTKTRVSTSVEIATEVYEGFGEININAKDVDERLSQITRLASEQANGLDELTKGMSLIDNISQTNASSSDQLSANAERTATEARNLTSLVGIFKLQE